MSPAVSMSRFPDPDDSVSRQLHLQRMSMIGEAAVGWAHDLNNQLECIVIYGDLLTSALADTHLCPYAEAIIGAAVRSAELTRRMLTLSKPGQHEPAPVDIHQVIADLETLIPPLLGRGVKVRKHLSARCSATIVDLNGLQNSLLNLILNARDAMPGGGDLEISTEQITVDDRWCSDQSFEITPGAYMVVSIADSGCGMQPEVLKQAFEPFFTTKAPGTGTGLGLPAVRNFAERHNGCVAVSSKLGLGTTVRLFLPLTLRQEDPSIERRHSLGN